MYDIIIVGAGPSGSSSGRAAGKAGLKTLLIEKETFPRYKPCGGGLSEYARSFLDFSIPRNIQEGDIFGIRIHYKGKVVEIHKKNRFASLVTRSAFDDLLLKKAKETGIQVKMGEKVLDLTERSDSVTVNTNKKEYKSKFVIIAEGSQGKLKYNIRKRDKNNEYGICMVTEIPRDNKETGNKVQKSMDLHFDITKMGYGWVFPLNNYYSVGIGGVLKYLPHPKKEMLRFLDSNNFENNNKLKGHLIPGGGFRRKTIGTRVILTGDAAGFVDIFAGEGLAYAIRSGQLAVKTIENVLIAHEDLNKICQYEKLCEQEFGDNLKFSLFFTRLIHSFPSISFNIMLKNDEIIDKYLDILANNLTYKKYVKWLVLRLPKFLIFNPKQIS